MTSPPKTKTWRTINSFSSLGMDKSSSLPVDNAKVRLGMRDKLSHSPQKSYGQFPANGYAQHQGYNYGHYSPDAPKCSPNLYQDEYYSHTGSQWQMHNPQVVNVGKLLKWSQYQKFDFKISFQTFSNL